MFIKFAFEDPIVYFLVVFTLISSIVLHELAHGVMAIYEGDDTPRVKGHITLNPIVHMGVVSLCCAFVLGIAWGMMPINPDKFRHARRSKVLVFLAGPMSNLAIALFCCLLMKVTSSAINPVLGVFAFMNLFMGLFNLLPLPGLDGFRALAQIFPRLEAISQHPVTLLFSLFLVGFLASGSFGIDKLIGDLLMEIVNFLST